MFHSTDLCLLQCIHSLEDNFVFQFVNFQKVDLAWYVLTMLKYLRMDCVFILYVTGNL